jgi:hypothetical protein
MSLASGGAASDVAATAVQHMRLERSTQRTSIYDVRALISARTHVCPQLSGWWLSAMNIVRRDTSLAKLGSLASPSYVLTTVQSFNWTMR